MTTMDDKLNGLELISGKLVTLFLTYADALEKSKSFPAGTHVKVTNDPNLDLNGEYTWDGLKLVKTTNNVLDKAKEQAEEAIKDAVDNAVNKDKILEMLDGEITGSMLDRRLEQRIERIPSISNDVKQLVEEVNVIGYELNTKIISVNWDLKAINDRVDEIGDAVGGDYDLIKQQIKDLETKVNNDFNILRDEIDQKFIDVSDLRTDLDKEVQDRINAIKTETDARIADIKLLNDGLTKEIAERKDGDNKLLVNIENYKTSNDNALANVRQEVAVAVDTANASAQKVDALDVRLKVAEGNSKTALENSATALSKANAAVDASTATASRVDALDVSVQKAQKDSTQALTNSATAISDAKAAVDKSNAVAQQQTILDARINQKNATYRQATAPTKTTHPNLTTGDIWVDTANKNTQKRWDGSAWVDITDGRIGDNATAISKLNVTVQEHEGKITAQGQQITDLQASVGGKADASALTKLEATVQSQENKITTNSNAITSLQGEIKDKASAKALNDLTTTVQQQGNDIVSQGKAITSVQAEVKNIAVGGDNLVMNGNFAKDLTNWGEWGPAGLVNKTFITKEWKRFLKMETSASGNFRGISQGGVVPFIRDTEYVISFLAYTEAATPQIVRVLMHQFVSGSNDPQVYYSTPPLTGKPVRYSYKFRSADLNKTGFNLFLEGQTGAPYNICISDIQLEIGNVVSAWKPSYREVENGLAANSQALTALEATVTTQGSTIIAQGQRMDGLKQEIDGKASSQALDQLKSTVTQQGKDIATNTTAITSLQGQIKDKADAKALTALETTVKKQGDDIAATSSAVTSVQASLGVSITELSLKGNLSSIETVKVFREAYLDNVNLVDEPTAMTKKVLRLGANKGAKDGLNGQTDAYMTIDPNVLYRVKTRFRRVSGVGMFYAGVMCLNADRTKNITASNIEVNPDLPTSANYIVASSASLGQWVTEEKYFKGISSGATTGTGTIENPFTFPARAAYARLVALGNNGGTNGGQTGQQDLDYLIMDNYTDGNTIGALSQTVTGLDATVKQQGNTITAQGKAITGLESSIGTKADAKAVNELKTTVTEQGLAIESNTLAVTKLDATLTLTSSELKLLGSPDSIRSVPNYWGADGKQNPKITLVAEPTATTGYVLRTGNNVASDTVIGIQDSFVAIDAKKMYRVKYRYRRVSGDGGVYASLVARDNGRVRNVTANNGTTAYSDISNSLYFIGNAKPALGQWVEGEYYFKGRSTGASTGTGTFENPRNFPALASYFSFGWMPNYTGVAGQQDLDYLIVEDYDGQEIGRLNGTAIQTLTADVKDNKDQIKSQSTAITKLTNDLNTTNQNVSKKAESSVVSALDSKVTEVDGRVKANTQSISNLSSTVQQVQNDVSKKADASVLTQYSTHAQTDAAVAAGITKYDSTITIGGRNFWIMPESFGSNDYGSRTGALITADVWDHQRLTITGTTSGIFSNLWQGLRIPNFGPISTTETGAVSFDILSPFSTIHVFAYLWGQANSAVDREIKVTPNQWTRVVVNDIVPIQNAGANNPSPTYGGLLGLRIRAAANGLSDAQMVGKVIEVKQVQAQLGAKATAFTRPDQLELNSTVANANAIKNTETKVTAIDNTVKAQAQDISQMKSSIDKKADATALNSLKTTVEQQGSTITSQGQAITSVQSSVSETTNLAQMIHNAKRINADPQFKSGLDGVAPYTQLNPSPVSVTRVARWADNPTTSTHQVNVTVGGAHPSIGLGGFYQVVNGRENARFVTKYLMKLPVGYRIEPRANRLGTGGTDKLIGPTEGTGKYEIYTRVTTYGTDFTGSNNHGHITVFGPNNNSMTFPIAQIEVYDVTDFAEGSTVVMDSLKASSDAITKLETTTKQQGDTLSTQAQQISGLQSTVSGKADSAALNRLETKVEQQGKDISSTSSALTQVESKLNNQLVGGDNIILNGDFSKDLTSWGLWGGTAATRTFVTKNNKRFLKMVASAAGSFRGIDQQPIIPFVRNSEYVISFLAYTDSAAEQNIRILVHQQGGGTNDPQAYYTSPTLTNKPVRYSFVFRSADLEKTGFRVHIEGDQGKPYDICMTDIQMELGNVSTAWKPSGREVGNDMAAAALAMTKLTSDVTEINGKVQANAAAITKVETSIPAKMTNLLNSSNVMGEKVANVPKYPFASYPITGQLTQGKTYTLVYEAEFTKGAGTGTSSFNAYFGGQQTFPAFEASFPRQVKVQKLAANAAVANRPQTLNFYVIGSSDAAGASKITSAAKVYWAALYADDLADPIMVWQPNNVETVAMVEQSLTSINGIQAEWTIKTETNGYVSGVGLINQGAGKSSFIVRADQFAIAAPAGSAGADGAPKYGFVYQATPKTLPNGTVIPAGLYVDNIILGDIDAQKINARELSAISANLGRLVTYRNPANPNGARMIMEGSLITVYDDNNRLRVRMGLW